MQAKERREYLQSPRHEDPWSHSLQTESGNAQGLCPCSAQSSCWFLSSFYQHLLPASGTHNGRGTCSKHEPMVFEILLEPYCAKSVIHGPATSHLLHLLGAHLRCKTSRAAFSDLGSLETQNMRVCSFLNLQWMQPVQELLFFSLHNEHGRCLNLAVVSAAFWLCRLVYFCLWLPEGVCCWLRKEEATNVTRPYPTPHVHTLTTSKQQSRGLVTIREFPRPDRTCLKEASSALIWGCLGPVLLRPFLFHFMSPLFTEARSLNQPGSPEVAGQCLLGTPISAAQA